MIRDCETYNRSPFQLFREVFISSRRASFSLLVPSGRKSALADEKHPEPVEIIRQIPQANLRPGPCLANRAQYQVASFLRLNPKNMFNARANLRPRPIAALLPFCQLAIAATFALYMFPVSFFCQIAQLLFGAIRGVCPYVAARVGSIEQALKHLTVMNCGICHRISANQLVLHIHGNMILVAERGLAMLLVVQRASVSFWRFLFCCQSAGISPALICAFSSRLLRCLGTLTMLATIIWPFRASKPLFRRWLSNFSNSSSMMPAVIKSSLNRHTVVASGTLLHRWSPRNRQKE